MYPPTQYSRIPASEIEPGDFRGPRKTWAWRRGLWRRIPLPLRVSLGFSLTFFLGALLFLGKRHVSRPLFAENTILFDREPRPTWLDPSETQKPLVLRLGIVSTANEFERREALREGALRGIAESDVRLTYRFVVGKPRNWFSGSTKRRLAAEMEEYGDILQLDIDDIFKTLSQKRYQALYWGGSVPHNTYDYFMTLDSDSFCRFPALARRLPHFLAEQNINLNPREHPMLLGRMGGHLTYWQNTTPDDSTDISRQDEIMSGPWFFYPSGIGYMLSSSLVNTLLSTTPSVPHHIHYPSDDVMIGSWVAALRLFPDNSTVFESIEKDKINPSHRIYPKPYLPYSIETKIIDDIRGWHDFPHPGRDIWRAELEAPMSWDSVCIHKVTAKQIKAFREYEEIRGEWVNLPDSS